MDTIDWGLDAILGLASFLPAKVTIAYHATGPAYAHRAKTRSPSGEVTYKKPPRVLTDPGDGKLRTRCAASATVGQMLVAVERTAMAKGEALGRFEELLLLIQDYGAYSADFAAANQRDRESRGGRPCAATRLSLSRPSACAACPWKRRSTAASLT